MHFNSSSLHSFACESVDAKKQKQHVPGLITDTVPIRKSNILDMGETGIGKTLTIESFIHHKKLEVVVSKCKAASLTSTRYTGPSVSDFFE